MPDTSHPPNWQSFISPPQTSASRFAGDSEKTLQNESPSTQQTPSPVPDDGGKKPSSSSAAKHKSMAVFTNKDTYDEERPPVPNFPTDHASSSASKKRGKLCKACGLPLSGHFVCALDSIYHMECFKCYDCSNPCSAKFFPGEAPADTPEAGTMVAFCEHCYFKRQDLLCHACDGALRGSYITALGKKYHVEHFTCSLCSVVFGSDDSYYEHEDSIYCRYHYSTLYAAKCEGCKTAILKQFVEVYRGGREQQWHPECYMINKFWNVMISPDRPSVYPSDVPPDNDNEQQHDSEERSKLLNSPNAESREAVLKVEQTAEEKSYHIWSILCGYEEATASCISDMLQYASSGKYQDTLLVTAKLVSKIEVLLSAIDIISAHIDPLISALIENDDNTPEEQEAESAEFKSLVEIVRNAQFTQLRKEPKTLCKKVVSFMSLLSKSREKGPNSSGPSQELLDSVTSMAHYLKLLIRHGLTNSLKYDRAFASGGVLNKFLDQVATHEMTPSNPLENLGVSGKANDRCLICKSSTEDDCASLDDKLWHLDCLQCQRCGASLGSRVRDARYLIKEKSIICSTCAQPTDRVRDDFTVVTKLHQFIYLVKIALARLQLVLKTYDARDKQQQKAEAISDSRPSVSRAKSSAGNVTSSKPAPEPLPETAQGTSNDQQYMTTLKDIRKLRSTRLSQQLSESSKRARRSRILDMPPSEQCFLDKNESTTSLHNKEVTDDTQPPSQPAVDKSQISSPVLISPEEFPATDSAQISAAAQIRQVEAPSSPKSQKTKRPGFIKRIGSQKRGRKFKIEEETKANASKLGRTTDLIKNEKSLILDDIPRIVAAEQARELRPNAYRHRRGQMDEEEIHVRDVDGKAVVPERYVSELSSTEIFYIRHIVISLLAPLLSQWVTFDELVELIETRKQPSLWEKFGKAFSLSGGAGSADQKAKKKTGVFGVSLEQQVEKYGVSTTFGVGPTQLRIPAFVDECVSAMRQMDMSVEGIFRKNGNIRRSKELAEMTDKNPDKTGMLTEENPIQLAALFKRYLRELPDSLLTFKLQKLWLSSQEITDSEARSRALHLICCLLPTVHRDVMEVLFSFLHWTSSFSHIDDDTGSKMDIHNLSTVITPNILYTKHKEGAPLETGESYFLGIEAVNELIKEYDRFSKVPPIVLEILATLDLTALNDLPSTEVLSKIQTKIAELQAAEPEPAPVPVPHVEFPKAAATRAPPIDAPVPETTSAPATAGIRHVAESPVME